jgi:hypothetical protein
MADTVLISWTPADMVPGLRSLTVYAELDPEGSGFPVDLTDVIVAALRQRYAPSRT